MPNSSRARCQTPPLLEQMRDRVAAGHGGYRQPDRRRREHPRRPPRRSTPAGRRSCWRAWRGPGYDLGAAEPLLAELRAGVAGTPLEPEIAAIAARVDVFDIDAALAHRWQACNSGWRPHPEMT